MRPFAIIVAFDSRYGIGKNGQLPWHLPADLQHFKEITTTVQDPNKKNAVIMGRKTWESLPQKFRPLPGRLNVVLSRQQDLSLPEGVLRGAGLDEALSRLPAFVVENIFVIGGAQIFTEAINHPLCQKLIVTHVRGDYQSDTFFPAISKGFFPVGAGEEQQEVGIKFQFCNYLRY